jgi:hypothetical protein
MGHPNSVLSLQTDKKLNATSEWNVSLTVVMNTGSMNGDACSCGDRHCHYFASAVLSGKCGVFCSILWYINYLYSCLG